MVSTSAQTVQPTITSSPPNQTAMFMLLIALVSLLGASVFFQPLLPIIAVAFVFGVGFFNAFSFRSLYFTLLCCFLIVSPAIPISERHFSKPISIGGAYPQDFAMLFLFAVALKGQLVQARSSLTLRFSLTEKLFFFYSATFFISLVVGFLNGNKFSFILGDLRDFLYLSLFWVYLWFMKTSDDVDAAFRLFVGVSFVFALVGFLDDALLRNFARYNSGISFLLVGATLMVVSMLLVADYSSRRKTLFFVLLVMLGGIFITFTRGLYLGFFVGLIAILLALGNKQSLRLLLSVGVLSAVVFFGSLALGFSIDKFVNLTTYRGSAVVGDLDISSTERILEVISVLNEFPLHPFFGAGAGGTVAVYKFGDVNTKEGIIDWWFIHNNYAQALHKSGLVGFIALMALWLGAVFQGFKLFRQSVSPTKRMILLSSIGTLVAFLICSITSPILTYINTNFLNALLFAAIAFFEKQSAHAS